MWCSYWTYQLCVDCSLLREVEYIRYVLSIDVCVCLGRGLKCTWWVNDSGISERIPWWNCWLLWIWNGICWNFRLWYSDCIEGNQISWCLDLFACCSNCDSLLPLLLVAWQAEAEIPIYLRERKCSRLRNWLCLWWFSTHTRLIESLCFTRITSWQWGS